MKNKEQILDHLEQQKERLNEMIDEPYDPRQPQLTNILCISSMIDTLKWVLSDES